MIYGTRDRALPLGDAPASLERRTLAEFQRWAIRRYYTVVDFADYRRRFAWSSERFPESERRTAEGSARRAVKRVQRQVGGNAALKSLMASKSLLVTTF
jgi:hypothetical protein